MEFTGLAECKFPGLKQLKLFLESGASRSIDKYLVQFLENHPSLEDLSYIPVGEVSLSRESVPWLKRLRSNHHFAQMLNFGPNFRTVECLDLHDLSPQALLDLENLNTRSVKKLRLHYFGDVAAMHRIAILFPSLTWLSMPSYCGPHNLASILPLSHSQTAN